MLHDEQHTNNDDSTNDVLAVDIVPNASNLSSESRNALDISPAELNVLDELERQAFFEWFYEANGFSHPLDYVVTVVAEDDPRFNEVHFDCESSDGITRHVG